MRIIVLLAAALGAGVPGSGGEVPETGIFQGQTDVGAPRRASNWFPHPSPDGRWIVFLSYEPGVEGHPENQEVLLRLQPAGGGKTEVLAKLFGGQGTLNVPSWAPDGRKLAFVSYLLLIGS
jgi:hypothetical protein